MSLAPTRWCMDCRRDVVVRVDADSWGEAGAEVHRRRDTCPGCERTFREELTGPGALAWAERAAVTVQRT